MKTIEQFYQEIHWKEFSEKFHLYAIIDSAQFQNEQTAKNIANLPFNISRCLFQGMPEEAHSLLAPYLINAQHPNCINVFNWLIGKELDIPVALWFASTLELDALDSYLKTLLTIDMPDAPNALLRFYDPRVFSKLVQVFRKEQLANFYQVAPVWWWWDLKQKKRLSNHKKENTPSVERLVLDEQQQKHFSEIDFEEFKFDILMFLQTHPTKSRRFQARSATEMNAS